MFALCWFVLSVLASPSKSKSRLEAENAALRHQLIVLRRKVRGRVRLTNNDRWFFIQLYRWFPSILQLVTVVQPETLVRWHRAGFRLCWRWKSGLRGGRPQIETDLRALIRKMSMENPLWGAPRIHGELLKLGYEVARSTVAKYMVKRRRPPSQGWRTFLRNHAPDIAAMDLFVVPTIGFGGGATRRRHCSCGLQALSKSQRFRRRLLTITSTIGLSVTKAEISVEWIPLGGSGFGAATLDDLRRRPLASAIVRSKLHPIRITDCGQVRQRCITRG
jgi:hypothetical protein